MREMSTVNEQIKQCYDELSKENLEVLKVNRELQEQIKAMKSDRPLLLAAELENRNLLQEIQQLRQEKDMMKANIRCAETQKVRLEKEIEDLQSEVYSITHHTSVVEKRKEKLENDLDAAKKTIVELYLAVESLDVVYEKCCAMEEELQKTKSMLEKSETNVDILYDELTQKHNEELELLHDSFSATTAKLEAVIAEKDETIANLTRTSIRMTEDDMNALEEFDQRPQYSEIFPANFSFSSLPPDDPHPSASAPEVPKELVSNTGKIGGDMKGSSPPSTGGVTREDFEKAIRDTPIVSVHSSHEVLERLQRCNGVCLNPDADWKAKSKALSEIRGILLSDSNFVVPAMVENYMCWDECLIKGMKELRSSLCRDYCITVALFSMKLGQDFFRQVNLLFKNLMNLAQSSTKIMSSSAMITAEYIAEHVRVSKFLNTISSEINSKSNSIRKVAFRMCNIILNTWPRETIFHQIKVLMEMVKAGCTDADVQCRQYGRDAYSILAERFNEEAKAVFESLDPKRQRMLMDTNSMPTTTSSYSVSNENASVSNKDRLHAQQNQFRNNRSHSDIHIRSSTVAASTDTPKACVTSLRSKPSIPRTIRTSQSVTFSKTETPKIRMNSIGSKQPSQCGTRKILVPDNRIHGSTHSQPTGSIFGPSKGLSRIAPPSSLTSRSGVKYPLGTPIVKPSLINAQKQLKMAALNK